MKTSHKVIWLVMVKSQERTILLYNPIMKGDSRIAFFLDKVFEVFFCGSKYQTSRDVWTLDVCRDYQTDSKFFRQRFLIVSKFLRVIFGRESGAGTGILFAGSGWSFCRGAGVCVCVKIDSSCLKGVKAYMLRMWKIQSIPYVDDNMRCPRSFIISLTDVTSIFILIKAIKSCSWWKKSCITWDV